MAKRKTKRLAGLPAEHKHSAGKARRWAVTKARKVASLARAGRCSEAADAYEHMWREYEASLVHTSGYSRGSDPYADGGHKLGTIAVKAAGIFRRACLKK